MTGPTLTGLDLVRDQLAEARRYTRVRPGDAEGLIAKAIGNLAVAHRQIDGDRVVPRTAIPRVCRNLAVGLGCMAAAPAVADAYITGALWELGDLANRLRKQEEAEGRDAELMAAFGPREHDR